MLDRLQLQRFEFKYLIDETTALAVRDFVSSQLELDEFSVACPNFSYPVHSIYFDSDDLHLYQSTINSEKNRFKLRLRFYSDAPESPVFFEIKRRVDSAILKRRGGVRREAVQRVLSGHLPRAEHLLTKDPKHLFALQRFSELAQRLNAKPKIHVGYLREAWLPADGNSVRVTMDRQVRDDPEPTLRLSTEMKNPVLVFGDSVVLEIKFTGRFPVWLADMVRIFNLRQTSAAKYVDGICRMGDLWGGGHSSEFVCKLLGAAATVNTNARSVIETVNPRSAPGAANPRPLPESQFLST